LRSNCLQKQEVKTDRRVEVTGRQGGRSKQLLDDLKDKKGCWKLKAAALDRTEWRNCFVTIHTAERIKVANRCNMEFLK
jgi:hypothetical protein